MPKVIYIIFWVYRYRESSIYAGIIRGKALEDLPALAPKVRRRIADFPFWTDSATVISRTPCTHLRKENLNGFQPWATAEVA